MPKFERDVELDAQLSVLAYKDDGGEALAAYSKERGIDQAKSIGLAVTLLKYLLQNPEYRVAYDARVAELSAEKGITIPEGPITPGCDCDYCELQRTRGVKDPELSTKENVFVPNLEQDSQMVAVAHTADNDELEAVTKGFGLTVDEGIERGKRLAVYCLDNPEYQKALDKRSDEIIAERKATLPTPAETEAMKRLGLEPSKELAVFIDQLADDALAGGPLSKPYVAAGAIRVDSKELIHHGFADLNAVYIDRTKFKQVFDANSGSSQLNN